MPHPLLPVASSLSGVGITTALAEGLKSPKAIAIFYVDVAKSCYKATGSKRVACAVAATACALALTPGPHQAAFIVACAGSRRGANKL